MTPKILYQFPKIKTRNSFVDMGKGGKFDYSIQTELFITKLQPTFVAVERHSESLDRIMEYVGFLSC